MFCKHNSTVPITDYPFGRGMKFVFHCMWGMIESDWIWLARLLDVLPKNFPLHAKSTADLIFQVE